MMVESLLVAGSADTAAKFDAKHIAALNRLLVKSLDSTIRENLGEKAIQKIEKRLFEKYGISLTQSVEEFHKLDAVLREFFGGGADGLEQRFLKDVCEIKAVNGDAWVQIEHPDLAKIILESFVDDDKKRILGTISDNPMMISEMIEACGLRQTSGYRKAHSLIDEGMLVPSGHDITPDGKRVTKYRSFFDDVKIDIAKNKISVGIHLKTKSDSD